MPDRGAHARVAAWLHRPDRVPHREPQGIPVLLGDVELDVSAPLAREAEDAVRIAQHLERLHHEGEGFLVDVEDAALGLAIHRRRVVEAP